jgi:ribosome-associated protein
MMESEELAKNLKRVLEDKKGLDVEQMDLRERSTFTDFFLVATGTSTTHVSALALEVDRYANENNINIIGSEGERESQWVLVDLGDVIVHVFLNETRALYNLDKLWSQDTMLLNKIRDEQELEAEGEREVEQEEGEESTP